MKTSFLLIFISINMLTFHTQGMAQTNTSKPKIASKSFSSKSKSVSTAAKKPVPSKMPRIKFDQLSLDLGTIKEDAVIEKSFEFVNVGEKDLVIINTQGSCGCTVPSASSLPVAPGQKGKIMVKYTAKNKVGPQKPTVTVTTNGSPSIIKLHMEAWVDQIPGGVN